MAALHVLKRSDSHLLRIYVGDDPCELAERLSADHAFDVAVVLSLPGLGQLVQNTEAPGHVRNGWHDISIDGLSHWLHQALDVKMGQALSNSSDTLDAPAGSGDSEMLDVGVEGHGTSAEVGLPSVLLECQPCDADKACVVRQRLTETIGPEEARLFLAQYRNATLKSAQGGYQRVFVNSDGISLKLV